MESESPQPPPNTPGSAASFKHRHPIRPHKHYRKTKVFFKVLGLLALAAVILAIAWFLGTRM
ncbi:hypothetical protein [Geminisphaera colitermitum]|uniref:hypothetical protein n=1 Tax=Geminisphaera colitermitum TaxID=1148786 RepID=UPI0012FEA29A|nr:hypothetical protein [Geminisphaera colitermitum]